MKTGKELEQNEETARGSEVVLKKSCSLHKQVHVHGSSCVCIRLCAVRKKGAE